MARVKIKFPDELPLFTAVIPVRIGDINYGGHVGNDAILSVIHEARMQWLGSYGYTELKAAGNALIMADVMIAYKGEAFYGDTLQVAIYTEEITKVSFDMLYRIYKSSADKQAEVAHAKTGMVCFDYDTRKVAEIKEGLLKVLTH